LANIQNSKAKLHRFPTTVLAKYAFIRP